MSIKSPSIQVEIGSEVKETSVIENMKKNPNFQDRRLLCFNVVSVCKQRKKKSGPFSYVQASLVFLNQLSAHIILF